MEKSAAVANAVAEAVNALALVAAPRVFAAEASKTSVADVRSVLLPLLANLEVVAAGCELPTPFSAIASASKRIHASLASHDSPPSGSEIQDAREALATLGLPDPPGGWDSEPPP